MSTPTAEQIDALLDFLEEHRDLARGNLRSIEGRTRSHHLWDEICTTLNAMGGCTKTTKQWQKVWTDKEYLAKKAAGAARKSASATGGGPSTAPSLSQWELKIVSIMGDGFGEPQTSARVPAFLEHATEETSTASLMQTSQDVSQQIEHLPDIQNPENVQPSTSQQNSAIPASDVSVMRNPITSTRRRREFRRHSASPLAGSSVRDRLFQIEERRVQSEDQRNAELAGIRVAIVEISRHMPQIMEQLAGMRVALVELCRCMQQIIEQFQSRK